MELGTAVIEGRWIGECEIKVRLGTVHEPVPNRIHHDITLVQFSQGRWRRACKVARAFGGGRYSPRQLNIIAQALTRNWLSAVRAVHQHKEDSFRMCRISARHRRIWDDFMEFQMGQMPGINEGTAYLANLHQLSTAVETVVVLPTTKAVPKGKLGVIDLGGRTIDDRSIFMVVARNDGSVLHKVAVTLPVTGDYESYNTELPLQEFEIGGDACRACQEQTQTRQGTATQRDQPE